MSDAVTALGGASATGFATVEETALQGMITLRGDLSAAAIKKAATGAAGTAMPGPLKITGDGGSGLAWMSPDELLVLCPYAQAGAQADDLAGALATTHALAVNVSDARAMFRVSGAGAREVLAKLCPLDFAPEAFGAGDFRRTRLAQVPAAVWMEPDGSIGVICFRSVAQYAFDALKTAASAGSEVGYLATGT